MPQKTTVLKHENDEFEFLFERRRYGGRYGGTTYTWAYVRLGDDWLQCGDPWPCITPKRSELIDSAIKAIAYHHSQSSPTGAVHATQGTENQAG